MEYAVVYSENDGDTWYLYQDYLNLEHAVDERNRLLTTSMYSDCLIYLVCRPIYPWTSFATGETIEVQ